MKSIHVALALASSIAITGCVDDSELFDSGDISQETMAITGGELTQDYQAVVALTFRGHPFCTGTLIGARTIMTAAHCLPPHLEVDATEIEIFFGNDARGAGQTIAAKEVVANAGWTEQSNGGDIGLLTLVANAPVEPMAYSFTDVSALAASGAEAKMVGFGKTSSGSNSESGQKRVGEVTIHNVSENLIHLTPKPSATCNGDSGGPVIMNEDGIDVVVGIHHRSNCVDVVAAERVDTHTLDFIQPFMEANEQKASCEQDGMCGADCEMPDPDCVCASDNLCTEACAFPEVDTDCAEFVSDNEEGGCNASQGQVSWFFIVALIALVSRQKREWV